MFQKLALFQLTQDAESLLSLFSQYCSLSLKTKKQRQHKLCTKIKHVNKNQFMHKVTRQKLI